MNQTASSNSVVSFTDRKHFVDEQMGCVKGKVKYLTTDEHVFLSNMKAFMFVVHRG